MTAKHTPAPWSAGTSMIHGTEFFTVCEVSTQRIVAITGKCKENYEKESIANAELIAAAPKKQEIIDELLEALNEFIRAGIGHSTNFENQKIAFEKARAAIAQATI